jgi:sugar/nucleoside kinase (ribokinase family)
MELWRAGRESATRLPACPSKLERSREYVEGEGGRLLVTPELLSNPLQHEQYSCSLQDYCKMILSKGPSIVVVTNGAEGVYVATRNTLYFHQSLPVKPVSTLGAGDAFGSTFVASLYHGKSIEEALVSGISNSCSVIQHIGAQTGLLAQKDLNTKLTEIELGGIQKFDL